ncbi:MAG: hypothetical protein V4632_06720 [Pseudomonadota bacterium]
MPEKTEWEIVDGPAPGARPTLRQLLLTVLGPWWRWKLAGIAVVAITVLVFFATVVGVFMLVLSAAAILALVVRKVTQWMRSSGGPGSPPGERQNGHQIRPGRFPE